MVTCCHVHTVVAMSAVLEHLSPDFQLIVATAGFLSVSLLFSLKVLQSVCMVVISCCVFSYPLAWDE